MQRSRKNKHSSSLISVSNINADSSCCESSSSASSCPKCKSSSSSCGCSSSSSSCGCSSSSTYSDTTSKSCSSSSSSQNCCNEQAPCFGGNNCEVGNNCNKLVANFNCNKNNLSANADIQNILSFVQSKLSAVKLILLTRDYVKNNANANILFLEKFIDTLFCVLKKTSTLKNVSFNVCKVNNQSECGIANRTYILQIKYNGNCGQVCKTIDLNFNWTQLTSNDSKSFNGILDNVNGQIGSNLNTLIADAVAPLTQN